MFPSLDSEFKRHVDCVKACFVGFDGFLWCVDACLVSSRVSRDVLKPSSGMKRSIKLLVCNTYRAADVSAVPADYTGVSSRGPSTYLVILIKTLLSLVKCTCMSK